MQKDKTICPVERAGGLDNFVRKLLQNPQKLLGPYIKEGMNVLDLGCGPGFFSVEMAKMLKNSGKVIAADLQNGMLDIVQKKITGTNLEDRIVVHKCTEKSIDLKEKVDFILAFYMVHEVPDQDQLFRELKSILKPGGQLFVIEPKFHVSKSAFESMMDRVRNIGFKISEQPKIFFSRAAVFRH